MSEYISRDAIIAEINKSITTALDRGVVSGEKKRKMYEQTVATLCDFSQIVKDIPNAHVKPLMRGKWIKDGELMVLNLETAREQYSRLGYPHRTILRLKCSNCGGYATVDETVPFYDFCPNCGADMWEENDE